MALNFPSAPALNDVYENWKWDGVRWAHTGSPAISVGPTPPTGAAAGMLWLDTNTGNLFVYYHDGVSGGWVDSLNGGTF